MLLSKCSLEHWLVSESDMRECRGNFLVSLRILWFGGDLRFSVKVDGVVVVGCEVLGVELVNLWSYSFGVGFFFWGLFLFGAWCGGMDFWWSG